ncbi:MAG: D-alanine--D-alanine ligase [Gammaproteobacteria bacterium]|nr:D-alanine--D-alanine ligase [Gammaproteobacteria bacterium]
MKQAITAADFGKVAVLMGGTSAEREVSLKSGNAVLAALRRRGVDAHGIDVRVGAEAVDALARGGFQRVFIALHGRGGEDGVMQGALEALGLPYTGSGVLGSSLGMDKWRSKLVWQAAGLPVPDYRLLDEASDFDAVAEELGLPLFVKPVHEGSSVGVIKVKAAAALHDAWCEANKFDRLVLAERFVGGGEYTVAILDGEALPVIKIEPVNEFYDYDAKYFRDDTRYLCPCGLPPAQEQAMQRLAQRGFDVLGCRGWARIDFLVGSDGAPYLLEANTVPGMTDHSLVPMAARAAGIGFDELVWRILAATLEASA